MVNHPLIHVLDARELLPPGWQEQIATVAQSDEMLVLEDHPHEPASGIGPWSFAVLTADLASLRFDWLWQLYHGAFRHFASESFGQPLFPSNRRSATITLNRLTGLGAGNDWHRDANPVTGVFYATSLGASEGGQLEVRGEDGAVHAMPVSAGTFVCFAGPHEHRVAPLLIPGERLAVAMTYYTSAEDQPFANAHDLYEV
jgi:2OG-Fe(II) oxygenase superfamily